MDMMKKLTLLLLTAFILSPLAALAQEMYAVWNGTDTFTFYYDKYKDKRSGTVYDMTTDQYGDPAWSGKEWLANVTKVVFDASFSDARPTITKGWFDQMTTLTSITGIEFLNTEEVCNMAFMFRYCHELTSLDVSQFNTSKVTRMNNMFMGCGKLTSLNLSNFNTQKVTDMGSMFSGCYGLTSLDVSNFDTQEVIDMGSMFYNCMGLKTINVSNFDTRKVEYMGYMFYGCRGLTTIDLRYFDISKVERAQYMFIGCTELTTILCNDDWSQSTTLTNSEKMFYNCPKLVGGTGTSYDETKTDASMARPESMDGPGYFTYKKIPMSDPDAGYAVYDESATTLTFYYDDRIKERQGLVFSAATAYDENLERNIPEWYETDVSSNTTRVIFHPSYANAKPQSMASWFYGFYQLAGFDNLDLLNTENVTDMSHVFNQCSNLYSLDISHFDMRKVTTTEYMFYLCSGLTTIYASQDLTTLSSIKNSDYMFVSCYNLVGGEGTEFMGSVYDITYARPDGGTDSPGYFTGKVSAREGDLNGDGKVNAADVTILVNLIMQCQ